MGQPEQEGGRLAGMLWLRAHALLLALVVAILGSEVRMVTEGVRAWMISLA